MTIIYFTLIILHLSHLLIPLVASREHGLPTMAPPLLLVDARLNKINNYLISASNLRGVG